MQPFIQLADSFLIMFYRLTGVAWADFAIGTFTLAIIALFVGEATVRLVFRFSRKHLDEKISEADKYQNLSMDALRAGNKEAYQAANKLAKEAFGHTFFQQLTLSGAFLWPVFFALAWMQQRFLEVEIPIPGTGWSLGFIGAFIIIYAAAFVFLKVLKRILFLSRTPEPRALCSEKQ
ncbi:hypothetical protein [Desulfobacca acetoxidans]|uniref:DUF106 domain-containing protein n=1 Tax=Desulfobacca acetoxidans (strain ATCC 700848 / DSM 11109 / ASRB2) TaxID=880072 RepID=F2NCC7_DESAR|nr:hypothetical protein [Desulfobacca acetoxidans]AEB08991.1 hypothetical protein Desac_1127 [Desulfobacca acetoxidans DSM 11109]